MRLPAIRWIIFAIDQAGTPLVLPHKADTVLRADDHSPLNWQGDDHTDLDLVGQWRGFLADNGAPGMPVMCTEAGSQQFTWDSIRPNPGGGGCTQDGGNSSCGVDQASGVRLTCINGGCTGVYRPSDLRDRIYAFEVVNKAIM